MKLHLLRKLQQAMLFVLVILLAAEPILVASSPQLHETQQEEIETFASRYASHTNTGEASIHIGSLGDLIGLLPFMQGVGGASFLADAAAAVMKALFKNADTVFKAVLNGLKLTDAFNVIIDFLKVTGNYIGSSIGNSLSEAVQFLQNLFTGGFKLWDNFVAFVKRVGMARLLSWGFDESSLLVGGIIRRGSSLSDEAVRAVDKIGDELFAAGIKLSDDAADGLALAAKSLNSRELQIFTDALRQNGPEHLETILTAYKNFGSQTRTGAEKIAQKLGGENFAQLMSKFATNNGDADQVFRILGNTNISKDALTIAMKQSPDAVHALSFWKVDFLNDDGLAKALAARAGKDADSLTIINNWTLGRPPTLEELQQVGINSRDGIGNAFALGKNEGYGAGFAQFARQNKLQFYYTHPEVSDRVFWVFADQADRDAAYWAINKAAIDGANGPVDRGMNLLSQKPPDLSPLEEQRELDALKAIWSNKSDAEIKAIFNLQPTDGMPFRFREFQLLYGNDYQYTFDPNTGNFFFFLPGLN